MMIHIGALIAGFLLDLVIGDPRGIPHPVCWIGSLITDMEGKIRAAFPKTEEGELRGGMLFAVLVMSITGIVSACIILLPPMVLRIFGHEKTAKCAAFLIETVAVCYAIAVRSMKTESMKVKRSLDAGDLAQARRDVSMIVGRDTENLTEEGVAKAAVETVAEGTGDGIISPLFWIALFGPVGGWIYKSVNTMDSMVGYRNQKYLYFGRFAAHTDDVFNYVSSRLAALLMILAAFLCGMNGRDAFRIWKRDRRNHKSPNSAQTESVCAGALGLRLAGDAWYFGEKVVKPYIGDEIRKIEPKDIERANRLMLVTAWLMLFVTVAVRAVILGAINNVWQANPMF